MKTEGIEGIRGHRRQEGIRGHRGRERAVAFSDLFAFFRLPSSAFSSLLKPSRSRAQSLFSIASFLVLWHLLAVGIASPYFPTPLAVARAMIGAFFERDFIGFTIQQHIASSLARIMGGFGLAAILAIPLGLASGWVRSVEHLTGPVVELIRPIPPLAWIPFAIYFFGDPFDAVFIVFLAAFFPILLSTIAGVKAIDPILIDAARTLGAKRLQLFLKVVVPAALGSIVTGMRIGLGVGWMCIMAAEMVGVRGGGLGVYIWSMGEIGRFDAVFAGMVIIGVVGIALTGAMGVVQKRITTRESGIRS